MNSSQRRKSKRELPYSIKLIAKTTEHYFDHDDRVMFAHTWCKHKCHGTYKVTRDWDHAEFKFSKEKDAVVFALKWL